MYEVNRVNELFSDVFGAQPQMTCFAPGRVNLIGEHTDYNGGHVFPCALDLGIYCAASRRDDSVVRMYSANFPDDGIIACDIHSAASDGRWADYVKAVINTFISFGYELSGGADLVFSGNLPDGSGLSSSAALEVLTATVLRELFGLSVTRQQAAIIGQFAENRYIGLNCGIMDQFASAMGKRDHAILLDTNSLRYEYAPIPGDKAAIIIINSGVKHSLASSAYNDRRRECETALAQLNGAVKTPSLCAMTPDEFSTHASAITDPVALKRARHAVTENARTLEAVQALNCGDIERFGELMYRSHISLRDNYEVSCRELDILVEEAMRAEGVLGSRMTGGGFGGCTVNLVRKEFAEAFTEHMKQVYDKHFGRPAEIYVISIGDGARTIVKPADL